MRTFILSIYVVFALVKVSGGDIVFISDPEIDCDDKIFDEVESYKCDNGKCIRKEDRCNKEEDCSDGSDEGIENCADIVGIYVGIILGVILLCCVCPCLLCLLCGCLLKLLLYCDKKCENRSHPVTQTTRRSYEPSHSVVSEQLELKPAADPELYNAESPPPYPAAIHCPTLPPEYDTIFPECSIRVEMQDVRTDGHFSITVEGLNGVGAEEDSTVTTSDNCRGSDS